MAITQGALRPRFQALTGWDRRLPLRVDFGRSASGPGCVEIGHPVQGRGWPDTVERLSPTAALSTLVRLRTDEHERIRSV